MAKILNPTRLAGVAALAAGVILAIAVIGYFDFGQVLSALRPVGVGGFLIVVLAQLALGLPLGLAGRPGPSSGRCSDCRRKRPWPCRC